MTPPPEDHQEITGQHFKDEEWPGEVITEINFYDCTFERCNFREAAFPHCKFTNCTFHNCDLSLIDVTNTSFIDARFVDSQVIGVNWTKAQWEKAGYLNAVHFTGCALSYSTFIGLKLHKMQLVKCVAKDVDFAEANLTEADCAGTDFADCRFLHTDLSGANFSGAMNYAIDVTLNTIKGATFSLPEAMSLLFSLDIVLEE